MFKSKSRKLILGILLCLCAAFFACGIFAISTTKDRGQTVTAEAATPVTTTIYWRYTSSNTTLELSSTQLTGGTARGSFAGTQVFANDAIPWKNQKADITEVVFNSLIAPASMDNWFYECRKLERIINIENLNTSNVVGMQSTFSNCFKLEALDVSHFDTSKVKSFNAAFQYCSSLTSLDVSNISTESATDMAGMFIGCTGLKTIDVSNFNTSKVTSIAVMFMDCPELEEVDLSNFEAKNITNAIYLFKNNTKLKKFKINDSFAQKTSALTDSYMLDFPIYRDDGTVCNSQSDMNKGGGYFTSPHTHDWVLASSEQLDCTVAGEKKFVCTEEYCTVTKTEEIPAKEHTYSVVEVKGSTCTVQGYTKSTCTVCGHTKQDYAELLPHPYEGVTTDPTCTAKGYTTYTCPDCNNSYVGDEVPARGHEWNDWHTTKPATEEAAGEEQRECQRTNCGEVETQPIPQLNHTHKFAEDWTSDETNHWHASTCGHNVKDGEAAHDWNNGEITTDPSCTAEGVKTFTCTVCSKTKTETIDKIAHTPESVAAVDPDCTNTGLTEGSRCKVCSTVLTAQEVVPAMGHNYEATEGGVAPTCTTAGSGKVVCSRCNDEQVGASIPALGHNPGTAATCTEPQTCTVCNTDLAPALGHDWSTVWSKNETNHWHICNRCDELNDEAEHTYDWVITKDPTEDEEGEKEEYCTVCDYANGNKETLAKLVVDDNGSVSDLPKLPDNQDYDLEIAVKESESKYNIEGLNKGYLVELFIVDGEDRNPYDDSKVVTLMLLIPDGMEEFTLYRMSGDRLTEISEEEYTVSDGVVTIRTTLPSEFVFNAPIPEQPSAGIPWWVWLIVGLVVVAIAGVVIIIIVVAKKKNNDGNGGDTEELKAQLAEQGEKIDELLGRDDGGFNTPVELDENGNVIFK